MKVLCILDPYLTYFRFIVLGTNGPSIWPALGSGVALGSPAIYSRLRLQSLRLKANCLLKSRKI